MKRSRFMEEQIIAALKEHVAGAAIRLRRTAGGWRVGVAGPGPGSGLPARFVVLDPAEEAVQFDGCAVIGRDPPPRYVPPN